MKRTIDDLLSPYGTDDEQWSELIARMSSSPADVMEPPAIPEELPPEEPPPAAPPAGMPQRSRVLPPRRPQPMQMQQPQQPEQPAMGADGMRPPNTYPTQFDRTMLALAALNEGAGKAANRLSTRPMQRGPSAYDSIQQQIAQRGANANQRYQQERAAMFQAAAEGRAQEKAAAEAAMRDPSSPQSEAAWRAIQFRRQESGLPPLPQELRGNFTAGDAEGFVRNAPQAFTAMQQRQQASEAAVRKQAEQAHSAQEQLDVLRAMGMLKGINTEDPSAIKFAYDTEMKKRGWQEAEKRARIGADAMRRNEGGTAAALPPGSASTMPIGELMNRPENIQDALTDIDRQMDHIGTGEGEEKLYKRLADKRKKLEEMNRYVLPGTRFTKTPTQKGYEQAGNLMAVRNDMHRILDAAKELKIQGIDEAILARVGEYTGAIDSEWLKRQFPSLQNADELAKKLARLKQVIANSIIVKKNEAELGAITGADMGLVHDMLGNPTGILELASGRGMQSLENSVNDVDSGYWEKMGQFGYGEPERPGATTARGAQPSAPQATTATKADPEPQADPMARVRTLWPNLTEQERAAVRSKLGQPEGWEP